MPVGYLLAVSVLESLKQDEPTKIRCLEAIAHLTNGKKALQEGDGNLALTHLIVAAEGFRTIPQAVLLDGMVKSDIAAAYTMVSNWKLACSFARESREILRKEKALAGSEGSAHMSLAIGLAGQLKFSAARVEFERAEQLFNTLPDAEQRLNVLRQNRDNILNLAQRSTRPWWKLWR